MACKIAFKERFVQLNNEQFCRLIDYGIVIAKRTASPAESRFIEKMTQLNDEAFWPGRGFDITTDFPERDEQRFWSRVFFDTSRAIFDRQIGRHDHGFWQAQAIHQAHEAALLFEKAVQEFEPRWFADSLDRREFNSIVNKRSF